MSRNSYDPKARHVARLGAVQALYQMETGGTGLEAVIAEFHDLRFGHDMEDMELPVGDRAHFERVMRGVVGRQGEIDKGVNVILREGWPLERLDATVRAILRAGAFELLACTDIPAKAVINEYLDIAHAFFGDEEARFINGVLDHLGRRWRAEAGAG